jgi:hypothetical protein
LLNKALIGALLWARRPTILVHNAFGISKQISRPVDVELRSEALGKALIGVECDVV